MHKALYREYRPQRFEDVVGQEHVIRTLKNEILSGNIGHAYMFSGTRGTGKTTAAKIFARALNCLNPIDGEPCNECAMCKSILDESSVDIFEIDAASNNSVDDIRELRENVKYSPAEAKYKVYIIDEAHMLSKGASNALLKTIEEPPEYVVFIFATTEPNKMIPTVLSRCQRFDFKRITTEEMKSRMRYICEKEGVEAEEDALSVIARNSQGALRDALSILDRCMLFGDDRLKYEDVVEVLGIVNIDDIFELSDAIIEQNIVKAMEKVGEFIESGKDIELLNSEIIGHMRNIMLYKASGIKAADIIEVSSEELERIGASAEKTNIDNLIRIINILSEVQNKMKYTGDKRTLLEVGIIKTSRPSYDNSKEALEERIKSLEKVIESGEISVRHKNRSDEDSEEEEDEKASNKSGAKKKAAPKKKKEEYEEVESEDLQRIEKSWDAILDRMKKDKRMNIRTMLTYKKGLMENNGVLYTIFSEKFAFAKNSLSNPDNSKYVEDVIKDIVHKHFSVKVILESELKSINIDVKPEEDEGEKFLKEKFPGDIIEIKDKIEENPDK